jgi:hypothetical protein
MVVPSSEIARTSAAASIWIEVMSVVITMVVITRPKPTSEAVTPFDTSATFVREALLIMSTIQSAEEMQKIGSNGMT